MMRTILFIHYDPQNNKLCSLTKQIPYTPEDSEMYFIDISLADKDRLKVKELKYLNNHYNDDQPYPWLNQPSHIASCHTPIKYMYIQLLKAMQTNFFQQKKKLDKIISTYDQQNLMWQRNYLPGFDKSFAQNSLSINGKWQILDQVHIFSVPADNNSSIQLCKMLRQVWREERKKIVKINTMYQEILLLLKIKLEQISTDSIEE